MSGVRIGGEAKLLDDGVVPVGDGDLRVPLCSDVLIETMRTGPL